MTDAARLRRSFMPARRCWSAGLGLALLMAAAGLSCCGNVIHDEGVAQLVPPVPQIGSASLNLPPDRRFAVRLNGPHDRRDNRNRTTGRTRQVTPVPLIEPGAITVRRAPNARVWLAGSADGTQPIDVDDFLLIELEDPTMPSGVRQLVAGPVGDVTRSKIPIENIQPAMPIAAGVIDLTRYIPACTRRLVGAVPMDLGTIAQSSAVYLIVDYPPGEWTHESCAAE